MKKLFQKTLTYALCVIPFLLTLWFACSWLDIVSDNCKPNPTHSENNFFIVTTEKGA